jgi:hypothetical protein
MRPVVGVGPGALACPATTELVVGSAVADVDVDVDAVVLDPAQAATDAARSIPAVPLSPARLAFVILWSPSPWSALNVSEIGARATPC